jgi:hypothetical protein
VVKGDALQLRPNNVSEVLMRIGDGTPNTPALTANAAFMFLAAKLRRARERIYAETGRSEGRRPGAGRGSRGVGLPAGAEKPEDRPVALDRKKAN